MTTPLDPLTSAFPRIGLFDSGVGGLSVMRSLLPVAPHAGYRYVADSGFAPYGERTDAYVRERCRRIAELLLARGIDLMVVACNTATAIAVEELRQCWPELPIVGVEPGVKPATQISRNGRIAVLATAGTLASRRYATLIERYAAGMEIFPVACDGLAGALEQHDTQSPQVLTLVERYAAQVRAAGCDTAVLGCTHYPFVTPAWRQALGPDVTLVDTGDAVARQVGRLIAALPGRAPAPVPDAANAFAATQDRFEFYTSGDAAVMRAVLARWLDLDADVIPWPG